MIVCFRDIVHSILRPAAANRLSRLFLLSLLLGAFISTAAAQDSAAVTSRPNLSMFTFDAGYGSIHDSYLTPITYHGTNIALGYEAMQPLWWKPDNWLWQLQIGADFSYTENDAQNNSLYKLIGDLTFDTQHHWKGIINDKLELSAGPMTQLRVGVIHNPANSNNTVTARAHWNVGATGMATFNTRLKRLPVTLRYQVQLPVIGVFFAPEYDESYYEIYLGNYSNLAHLGYWGNRFDMTNYVGADLHLGRTTLRVGYRARLEHWNVNNLKVHDTSHSLVIGIGTSTF
ncbi:MAG: DUF3316 domain-containing protein [Muribaculaceae bacterium]|nr:DUF3316 domain-containing protein [Muribaculaceae bacterium]